MSTGQRFARLVTDVVVRRPALWRLFRGPMRRMFDRIAPSWDTLRRPDSFAPLEAALAEVSTPPKRALDIGTGTGSAAVLIARRWPETEVVGVDVADAMLEEARKNLGAELGDRVRFQQADAAALPFDDGSFDLIVLANMIPFFDELERLLSPGGHVAFAFSAGAETPIYVPPGRLRTELARRGFGDFREVAAARGTGLLARKIKDD